MPPESSKFFADHWDWVVFAKEWPMFALTFILTAYGTWLTAKAWYKRRVDILETSLSHNVKSEYPARQKTGGKIALMGVDFTAVFIERDDLGNPIVIHPIVRNDYPAPVNVRVSQWKPAFRDFPSKIAENRIQTKPPDDIWSPRFGGHESAVIHPAGVFRAGIEIEHASLDGLKERGQRRALGTITIEAQGKEHSFNI